MSKFAKGSAYAVTGLIAVIVAVASLGVISQQSSTGSGVVEGTTQNYEQDRATEKLEFTKAMLLQDLRFSTLNAELDITRNGGTSDPETYWICNNQPQPVTREEFATAISNVSLNYMEAYLTSLDEEEFLKEKDIAVSNCSCISVDIPEEGICDHTTCLQIGAGLLDQVIEVSSPVLTTYKGPLNVNDVGATRAPWFREVLENEIEDLHILQVMSNSMAANCPEDQETKFQIAYVDVCEYLKKELDPDDPDSVYCEIQEIPMIHQSCIREQNVESCFSADSSIPESDIKFDSGNAKSINLYLRDDKYYSTGRNAAITTGGAMEWNVKMVFSMDGAECTPINC